MRGAIREREEGSTVQGRRRTFLKLVTGAGVAGALGLAPKQTAGQTTPAAARGPRTSPAFKYHRLSKNDAAVLPVDHQSGLISWGQDDSAGEFQNNVLALADIAKYDQLPTS
jgi:hypothetical protein